MPDLGAIRDQALAAVADADDLDALDQARVTYTGRRSDLVAVQKQMGSLDADQRREQGKAINGFKAAFEAAYATRNEELTAAALDQRLAAERLDLTLPPRRVPPGRAHLLTQVADEITGVMRGLGYRIVEGPEVESAAFNFDLLNIPPEHPARQEMDTIYVATAGNEGATATQDVVLRTHTSPVQARVMTTQQPPIAIAVPGRVYRQDSVDATHSPVFHQVEVLLVDEGVTMADLRGTLLTLSRALFGADREIRMRPSMFPFTEPSAEIDVSCGFCDGDGSACRVCSGTGWIEILGSGMVDPTVLSACGIDPARYSGFAFGIGIERVAMLRHGVADIREFFDGDARFLARF